MEDRIDISMPTEWNQLSAKQMISICQLYMRKLTEPEFLALAAIHLSGMKVVDRDLPAAKHIFRYAGRKVTMTIFQFQSLCNAVDFLLGEPDLDKQLFPVIRIGLKKYYGPADRLMNISFGEWLQTDIYFRHYKSTKERKFLELGVASMYRRMDRKKLRSKNYDGDPREAFNEYLVEKRAGKFRKVSTAKLRAVYIYFSGSMKRMKAMYPLTLDSDGGGNESNLMRDTLAIIDQLNNDDVTKNADVQRTRLYEVLTRLEIVRDHAKKLREKVNKK